MPKTYTEKERQFIIKRLKEVANDCLCLYGVKKTTVDEIVKRVNIPKGTFYLFYESKESLLFDVINDLHESIQSEFIHEVSALGGQLTTDKITNILCNLIKKLDETCLLKIMTNGDMELLMRKLPDKVVEEHLSHDDNSMEQFLRFIPNAESKNIKAFSGALRGVFLTMLNKREIGEDVFDEALKIMIHGIILQLMEG
ncbi:MAG: TetR family transcriptional regulator [Anaerocolumna sp.]|jgi:AcrR family transcriptional regulator|nr:TetR family transcriptional regulator [Anaerocolumna sp.]